MSMTPNQLFAISELANVLSDTMLLGELGPKLTCTEANVLADFVRHFVSPELAVEFLASHADGDDDGDDLHYLDPEGRVREREDDCSCEDGHECGTLIEPALVHPWAVNA